MIEILILASIAAAGILFLIFKIAPLRRILVFDAAIDVFATTILCIAMAGTFTGIMIGLVAGTMISIVLWVMKKIVGCDTLTAKGWVKTSKPTRIRIDWAHLNR